MTLVAKSRGPLKIEYQWKKRGSFTSRWAWNCKTISLYDEKRSIWFFETFFSFPFNIFSRPFFDLVQTFLRMMSCTRVGAKRIGETERFEIAWTNAGACSLDVITTGWEKNIQYIKRERESEVVREEPTKAKREPRIVFLYNFFLLADL